MKLIIGVMITCGLVFGEDVKVADKPTPAPAKADPSAAAINYMQGVILDLQQQLIQANQTILKARVCSDAGIVWSQCDVDEKTFSAKPKVPPPGTNGAGVSDIKSIPSK